MDAVNIPACPIASLVSASSASGLSKSGQKRSRAISSTGKIDSVSDAGISKRKQSKSRNGCATCKKKRLKCDETHPKCRQCDRRGVECEGYAKEFKWKTVDEKTIAPATATLKTPKPVLSLPSPTPSIEGCTATSPSSSTDSAASTPRDSHGFSISDVTLEPYSANCSEGLPWPYNSYRLANASSPTETISSGTIGHRSPMESTTAMFAVPSPPSSYHFMALDSIFTSGVQNQYHVISSLMEPPRLLKTESNCEDEQGLEPLSLHIIDHEVGKIEEIEKVEEASHDDYPTETCIAVTPPSRRSSPWQEVMLEQTCETPHIMSTPNNSVEWVSWHYHHKTCYILSMTQGEGSNLWRELMWDMVRVSSGGKAVYHALASLTHFHMSRGRTSIQGLEHKSDSTQALQAGINEGTVKLDVAIATTLTLAFAESWDNPVSSGWEYIIVAKGLFRTALAEHRICPKDNKQLRRLRFLYNAWLYLEVIARLTTVDKGSGGLHGSFAEYSPLFENCSDATAQVDPLMGCAITLFPIIGDVADLVHEIRKRPCPPTFHSKLRHEWMVRAIILRDKLENWELPKHFRTVKSSGDPLLEQHARLTAHAYRCATMLLLHQAIPEMPSINSIHLAHRAIEAIETVPDDSNSIIVHIYPLLAVGSEVSDPDKRNFVLQRYQSMRNMMGIGVIDKCIELVMEVWAKRDAHAQHVQGPRYRQAPFGVEQLDPRMTVVGELHWLTIMASKKWEVLLG